MFLSVSPPTLQVSVDTLQTEGAVNHHHVLKVKHLQYTYTHKHTLKHTHTPQTLVSVRGSCTPAPHTHTPDPGLSQDSCSFLLQGQGTRSSIMNQSLSGHSHRSPSHLPGYLGTLTPSFWAVLICYIHLVREGKGPDYWQSRA